MTAGFRHPDSMTIETAAVRRLGPDDVDALVELNERCELAETGESDHELASYLRSATEEYQAFGVDDDAGLAAFAWVDCSPGSTGFEGDVRVRPGLPPSVARPALEAIRAAARAADPTKPLHLFANHSATPIRHWWESIGATEVRHFFQMSIDLGPDARSAPQPPSDVTVRPVTTDDLRTAYDIVHESFAEHFGRAEGRTFDEWWAAWNRSGPADLTLWWLAEVDGAAVSTLLATTHGDDGHVGTLGTLPAHRGRGLGTLLLLTSFAQFHARGFNRVTLGVDAQNETGAVNLYKAAGMHPTKTWLCYALPTT